MNLLGYKILVALRYFIAVSFIISGIFALIFTQDFSASLVSMIIGLIILPFWNRFFQVNIYPRHELGLPAGIDLNKWRRFWKTGMHNRIVTLQKFKYAPQQIKEQTLSFLTTYGKLISTTEWEQTNRYIDRLEKNFDYLFNAYFFKKYDRYVNETIRWYLRLHPKKSLLEETESLLAQPDKKQFNQLVFSRLYNIFKYQYEQKILNNKPASMSDLLDMIWLLNRLQSRLNIYGDMIENRQSWERKLEKKRQKIEALLGTESLDEQG